MASAHVYPVYPDWLERMLAPFTNPKIALAYGKQRGDSNTKFSEKRVFAQWFPDHAQPNQAHPFCNNANAAIRRELWQARPYDESISGLEDLEWANWAIEQGYLLSYIADAEVIHVHNESPSQVYNRYRREAMAFKAIFPNENFNLVNFLQLVVTNIINDLQQAIHLRVFLRSFRTIFWFRWMQFWGTYRGYHHSGPLTQQLRQKFYYPENSRVLTKSHSRDIKPIQYNEVIND
jgi:GT2 family glycosyltransferase